MARGAVGGRCLFEGGCGRRYFTDGAAAEGEERARSAAMFLDQDGMDAGRRDAGLDAECHGQGEHGEQGRDLAGIGDVRVLQSEALGFQLGEESLDGPSLAIAGQRVARFAGASQRQKLVARSALVGKRATAIRRSGERSSAPCPRRQPFLRIIFRPLSRGRAMSAIVQVS